MEGIKVLDAGVGPGRHAYIPINNKATFHGVDLSNAVIQAKNNYSNVSNALFVQTDLMKLPYPKNYFDFIYSIGVLHHTPNPKLSFLSLVKHLKPGGSIAISVYNKGALLYEYAKRLRKYSVNINHNILYRICWIACLVLYPIYRIPILKLLIYYCPIDMNPNFEWRVLNTFDAYSPKYASTQTWSEVYSWFEEAGLKNINLQDTASISLRGWK